MKLDLSMDVEEVPPSRSYSLNSGRDGQHEGYQKREELWSELSGESCGSYQDQLRSRFFGKSSNPS